MKKLIQDKHGLVVGAFSFSKSSYRASVAVFTQAPHTAGGIY
jgi:hypothetical protein